MVIRFPPGPLDDGWQRAPGKTRLPRQRLGRQPSCPHALRAQQLNKPIRNSICAVFPLEDTQQRTHKPHVVIIAHVANERRASILHPLANSTDSDQSTATQERRPTEDVYILD